MTSWLSGLERVETCLLEGEIPLRGAVGVVDEHERGIVPEALGLLDHGDLVLADEAAPEKCRNRSYKWDGVEDVPCRSDIDPAGICNCRSYSCEAGEPLVSAADGFVAAVGKNEVDGSGDGLAVDAEQFVGRAVSRWRMGGHAEAVGDGLEVLFLFVDAGLFAPPPGLVDEGSVGRVHEADDAVVDVAGQVGGEMRTAGTGAELGDFGRRGLLAGTGASGAGLGDVDPGVSVTLFAGKSGGIDLRGIECVAGGERGDLLALAAGGLEGPSVVFAGELMPVEPSAGKRDAAVRATVAHGEELAVLFSPQHERNAQEHGGVELPAAQRLATHGRIPVVVEQRGGRRLGGGGHLGLMIAKGS